MITVKKVNLIEKMSEETPCFTCDVYENGKLLAHVSNVGQGGCNRIIPAKSLTYKDVEHLGSLDNEFLIMVLVEETAFTKKHQNSKLVLKHGDNLYTVKLSDTVSKLKNQPNYKTLMERRTEKYIKDGYKILNTNLVI